MDPDEHRRAWLARWGGAYATDAESEAAYVEALRTLNELREAFGEGVGPAPRRGPASASSSP